MAANSSITTAASGPATTSVVTSTFTNGSRNSTTLSMTATPTTVSGSGATAAAGSPSTGMASSTGPVSLKGALVLLLGLGAVFTSL